MSVAYRLVYKIAGSNTREHLRFAVKEPLARKADARMIAALTEAVPVESIEVVTCEREDSPGDVLPFPRKPHPES